MARADIDALLKRHDRAEQKRAMFASLMRDCYAYAMPERDAWTAYGHGQDRQVQVYDSTAIVALGRFANRLQQALFPPQQRWARLSLPPEAAARPEAQDVQVDLEAATDLLFRHVNASAFDQVANEWAQDLAAGVGCMLVEDGRWGQRRPRGPRLRFQAIPSALVAFDEGPWGTVEGVFFVQNVPARLVKRTYPDAQGLPDSVIRAEREEPHREIPLIQATYYDADDDLWRFEVLVKDAKVRIVERQYRTNPWIVTRWSKAPGETHGRGPLTQALPDIRVVNKLMELALKAGSIAVAGVWTALDDGILNPDTIRIAPGAVISVGSNGGARGPSLRGLEMPANFQLNEMLQDKLKTNIRQILMDDPLPPEVQAGITATEIIERMRRFQADTGAFGRLQTDAVTPLITRVVDILDQAGEFGDPRFAGLMDALQDDIIQIQATSPLSQAQDRADVQAVMMLVQGLAGMGEVGAAMLGNAISLERAGAYVAKRSGVAQELIPTEEELRQRAQAAQDQQAGQTLLASPVAAQVAGALAGAATRQPEPAA